MGTTIRIQELGETAPKEIIAKQLQDGGIEKPTASCVCVGDAIETYDDNTLRGHGTQVVDDQLQATVCGIVDRVNKLVTVRPLHRRYVAEIGDIVVGRVTEVVAKRWRIDLQSRQEAHLLLSAVSLPGGVQRRRTQEDELNMRSVFKEGDLVSAEVQSIHHDGTVLLHTRSTKYGKLSQGRIVRVPAELVRRQRRHFQHMESVGVDIVLGCNGIVWVTHHPHDQDHHNDDDDDDDGNEKGGGGGRTGKTASEPSKEQRIAVARVSQSLLAMSKLGLALLATSIVRVVELSVQLGVEPKLILDAEFLTAVAAQEELRRQEDAVGMENSMHGDM